MNRLTNAKSRRSGILSFKALLSRIVNGAANLCAATGANYRGECILSLAVNLVLVLRRRNLSEKHVLTKSEKENWAEEEETESYPQNRRESFPTFQV